MTTAWETAKGLVAKHTSTGGIFVRLASNGDKVTGERYETFDAKNPAHQADGKRPRLRVSINFFVLAEGAMKVIEGGPQWFKDVLRVRDKYGLDKWSFKIERHGEAGDPKTKYTILPQKKIGAAAHDLEAAGKYDQVLSLRGPGEAHRATPRPLSEEARAARAPRPPEELVDALQDRIHPTSGRLRSAKKLAIARRK